MQLICQIQLEHDSEMFENFNDDVQRRPVYTRRSIDYEPYAQVRLNKGRHTRMIRQLTVSLLKTLINKYINAF